MNIGNDSLANAITFMITGGLAISLIHQLGRVFGWAWNTYQKAKRYDLAVRRNTIRPGWETAGYRRK